MGASQLQLLEAARLGSLPALVPEAEKAARQHLPDIAVPAAQPMGGVLATPARGFRSPSQRKPLPRPAGGAGAPRALSMLMLQTLRGGVPSWHPWLGGLASFASAGCCVIYWLDISQPSPSELRPRTAD
jgi:hypothetical protein